jgi:FkbM family methyltransferase
MTTEILVESRQILPITHRAVGEFGLWVRAEEKARKWDLEVTEPILLGDEYELEPLVENGHRPGWILDVGAHIGAFTLRAKRLWPEARVVAVEPDPDSAALLRRNAGDLPGVEIVEAALVGRDDVEQVRLRQAGRYNLDRNAAASSVEEVNAPLAEQYPAATTVVQAMGILELLHRQGLPEIDLLKLDCEGAEAEILEALAADGYLPRVGWIRGEWHHFATIPRIEAALADTHIYNFHRDEAPWGAFIAHRKDT